MKQSPWNSPVVVFALVFSVVLSCGMLLVRELKPGGRNNNSATANSVSSLPFVANWQTLAATGVRVGDTSAPVQVVLFADYQCAGCAALHEMFKVAHDSLRGTISLVTRHYPLSGHAHARAAANAAECAAQQQKFGAYENSLYAQQASIGIKSWLEFANEAGIADTSTFAKCVRDGTHLSRVDADRLLAAGLKFPGTPVYVVNGHPHFGAPPLDTLLAQLREASALRAGNSSGVSTIDLSAPAGAPRTWLPEPVLSRTIMGADSDELLLPGGITLGAAGEVVVFDFGSMELRAFRVDGRQSWRFGRKGAGPGEFRNAMDLKRRTNGDLSVLDMANRRITIVSSSGQLKRMIPLKVSSSRFLPLSDSARFGLMHSDSTMLWRAVDASGSVVDQKSAPADLAMRHSLEREAFTAPLESGSVMTFRWSDQLLFLDGAGHVTRRILGIESHPFPGTKSYAMKVGKFKGQASRIDPNASEASRSITSDGTHVFVLFAGNTENRNRIVDVYTVDSATYTGSLLLPSVAAEITSLPDGMLAVVRLEPVPAIDIWKLPTSLRRRPSLAGSASSTSLAQRVGGDQ